MMRLLCAIGWHNWQTQGWHVHGVAIKCFSCGRERFKPCREAAENYGGGLWLSPNGPKGRETLRPGKVS